MIIDAHVHAFPAPALPMEFLSPLLKSTPLQERVGPPLKLIRSQARALLGPIHQEVHRAQTLLRHLPAPVRDLLDGLSGILPAGSLLLESTPSDLLEQMDTAGVDSVFLIAQEPLIPNPFVLDFSKENASRIHAVVNIPKSEDRPAALLRRYKDQGARALKIHPAADGEDVHSPRYHTLLGAADELGLPVIIHTGCIHSRVLYRSPEQGHASNFTNWYHTYTQVRFVLAHMNFHEPNRAMDLMEEFPNLYTDTSWQPAETIAEAVRRVGADRILFGTDWPFVGNNFLVGIERIRDCVESGFFSQEEADAILGENAQRLFSLETHAS